MQKISMEASTQGLECKNVDDAPMRAITHLRKLTAHT